MKVREERVSDLYFTDRTSEGAPAVEGLVRRVSNDLVAYVGGSSKSLTAGAVGGEANTSSNVGGGVELAKAKSGVDLPFRTLVEDHGINISQETDTVEIGVGWRQHFLLMGG